MAVPSSQAAAGWVKDGLIEPSWVSLREFMIEVVTERWRGRSSEEVSEFVEENLPYVANHLREERDQSLYDGAVCSFDIDSEDDPYVKGVGGNDGLILDKLKRISPYDFERVCADLLNQIGGDARVTSKSRDGGVDFIAVGLDILPVDLNCPHHCRASVIGQAKRYGNKLIAEKALREFVGASILHRNELRIRKSIFPLSPVLLAFWTTSNFEPNTKIFARQAGVWLMDGYTLSSYLNRVGLRESVLAMPDEPSGDEI